MRVLKCESTCYVLASTKCELQSAPVEPKLAHLQPPDPLIIIIIISVIVIVKFIISRL